MARQKQHDHRSRGSSARTLGRTAATLLTAGMIIGTGIFGALGATAEKAGSALLLAMIPGALVAWSTGVSGAQLGVNFPEPGGAFVWARAFDYNSLGFIAGCCYLGQGLNSFGISFTSKVVIGLMLTIVALLMVFVFFSAPHVQATNLKPSFDKGSLGFMAGAAIFFWAWDAFMRTAIMAGEMKDPRRTIPFSIAGGIAIAAVVFYAVATVTLGVLGAQEMGKDDVPLFKAATQAVGSWGGWVILAAAWLASINELVSDLLSVSRVGLAMGAAHEMPKWLGQLHPRFKVPRHAVVAIGLVTFALVLFFDLRQILPLASFYLLVWFAITHFSALHLKKKQRLTSPFFSWFGLVGCFVLLFFIPPILLAIGTVTLVLTFGARFIMRQWKGVAQ
ncbi:MAG: hypothetical protein DMF75_03330 [Acidobacteria bacterium]|nr:MAG: hypothetical protein DMF75_03330 [Acidobacteriota bacterium]